MDLTAILSGWDQLGWGVLVVLTVFLIFRGLLVPYRSVRQLEDDRDHWRTRTKELTDENLRLLALLDKADGRKEGGG
jgi:hypothetical protein